MAYPCASAGLRCGHIRFRATTLVWLIRKVASRCAPTPKPGHLLELGQAFGVGRHGYSPYCLEPVPHETTLCEYLDLGPCTEIVA